jgi:hypothetical protein
MTANPSGARQVGRYIAGRRRSADGVGRLRPAPLLLPDVFSLVMVKIKAS